MMTYLFCNNEKYLFRNNVKNFVFSEINIALKHCSSSYYYYSSFCWILCLVEYHKIEKPSWNTSFSSGT